MGSKRGWFGTSPLWSHLRRATPSEERGNPVDVVIGVDRAVATHLPFSPNVTGGVDVVTFGMANPGAQDQGGWDATKGAIRAAMRARMEYGFPLVLNADDALDRVVAGGAGDTYEFTVPHVFAVGDVLYFVRPSSAVDRAALHEFGWARVTAIPSALEVELDADPSTDDFGPEAGDRVLRVSSLWTPLFVVGAPQFGMAKSGDHHSPEILWRFQGSPSTEIHAAAVDLTVLPS